MHSEFNHSANSPTHFFQIWIEPNQIDIAPSYEQKSFSDHDKRGQLRLVASANGAENSVTIHADASLYAGLFDGQEQAELSLSQSRKYYVHLVRGSLTANNTALAAGDALLLHKETILTLKNGVDAEVLVFDLAA
jgi:quercetin 2,3-dioxygenase